jgi:hypothetical protein
MLYCHYFSILLYIIRKVLKNQEIKWAHQLLDYVHDINIMGENIDTIKENTLII